MVAGVTSDEEHVDGPVALAILLHHRIDRGEKKRDAAPLLGPILEDRWKITHQNVIGRKIGIPRWCRAPAHRLLHTPRHLSHEVVAVTDRIEIVKDLGTMMLDLSEENVLQRG